jgi:hypothetical protein
MSLPENGTHVGNGNKQSAEEEAQTCPPDLGKSSDYDLDENGQQKVGSAAVPEAPRQPAPRAKGGKKGECAKRMPQTLDQT